MPNFQFYFGALQVKVRYVQWREGLAYFRRRIPEDLRKFYPGEGETLFYSLKTRKPEEAAKAAHRDAQHQDVEWQALRQGQGTTAVVRASAKAILQKYGLEPGQWNQWREADLEPDSFIMDLISLSDDGESEPTGIVKDNLPPNYALATELFYADPKDLPKLLTPTLSEVKQKHLDFYPNRTLDEQFHRALNRFIALNGDIPVDQYRRAHGNAFVRDMLDDGLKGMTQPREIGPEAW